MLFELFQSDFTQNFLNANTMLVQVIGCSYFPIKVQIAKAKIPNPKKWFLCKPKRKVSLIQKVGPTMTVNKQSPTAAIIPSLTALILPRQKQCVEQLEKLIDVLWRSKYYCSQEESQNSTIGTITLMEVQECPNMKILLIVIA